MVQPERIVAGLSTNPLYDKDFLAQAMRDVDWEVLFKIAKEWELEPIVLFNLRNHFSAAMPDHIRDQLTLREREVRGWAITKSMVTGRLATMLESEGIPTIVLKGPAVSLACYGDISLRSFSDIDLLVAPRNLTRARDLFLREGFSRDYEVSNELQIIRDGHALEMSDGRTKIELHAALFPRHLRLEMSHAELFRDSRTEKCGSDDIRILSNHHLLLYLCAHAAKHVWSNPRWTMDIVGLLNRISGADADKVKRLANRTHSRKLLWIAMERAKTMVGARAAKLDFVDASRKHESWRTETEFTPFLLRLSTIHPHMRALLYWISCRERVVDRAGCLIRVAFVPTENDSGPSGIKWVSRPLRLGWRVLKVSLR